jgi:hypothetical protein
VIRFVMKGGCSIIGLRNDLQARPPHRVDRVLRAAGVKSCRCSSDREAVPGASL